MPGEEPVKSEEVNFKEKYRSLKRKMRFLIYEQECFQEELRRAQRKLLKISRDKNFLLDRLLQYERVIDPGTDSDSTLSSEDSSRESKKPSPKEQEKKVVKKKRRPKKKPTPRLQGTPMLGDNRNPLPHNLHSPPQALHQQLPHLAELMRKAAEGLPITQAPTMQVPGSTSANQDPQQLQQSPPLPSPLHPLLSPLHPQPHPLLSPTGGGALAGLPPGLSSLGPNLDPRVFDRGLHQPPYSMPGLPGMGLGGSGLGHLGGLMRPGDAGLPQMDLTALAALDKVHQQQERSRKKSKKDSSDKHSSSLSQGPSSSTQHQVPLPQPSTSSTHDDEDLVIDVEKSKR